MLKSLIDTVPSLKTSLQDNSDRLRESVDVIKNLAKIIIDKVRFSTIVLFFFLYNTDALNS